MDWLDATGPLWFALLLVTIFFNGRAAFKLLVDWKGMLTTCRFVEDAYAGLDALPDEAALEHAAGAPVFVHLVPAYYEPAIAGTLTALLGLALPARHRCTWSWRPARRRSARPIRAWRRRRPSWSAASATRCRPGSRRC